MKKTIKFILIFISIIILFNIGSKVEAANLTFSVDKQKVNVGDTVTVTATVTAAQWDLKITSNGKTLITSSELDNYESNITKTISTSYKATDEGTLTFIIQGDVTDVSQKVEKINKSLSVTVEKVQVPEPKPEPKPEPESKPDPEPEQKPEPEKPVVEEKPNFTDTNKKMYATKDNMNLRKTWSTESEGTKVNEGTELTVTATSNNKVNGYIWYRVSYEGKTLYVASNLLTDKKPEEPEEKPTEVTEEPAQEIPQDKPTEQESNIEEPAEEIEGLKLLEIEGLKLSPVFKSNVYEYRVILKENLESINIKAEPTNDKDTVVIAGNNNLQEGENLITIITYNAKKEVKATYQISLNKNTLDLSSIDKMFEEASKNQTIKNITFIGLLVIILIALVVVLILKNKISSQYENEEEQIEEYKDSANKNIKYHNEHTVSKEKNNTDGEAKKKGKHF